MILVVYLIGIDPLTGKNIADNWTDSIYLGGYWKIV